MNSIGNLSNRIWKNWRYGNLYQAAASGDVDLAKSLISLNANVNSVSK